MLEDCVHGEPNRKGAMNFWDRKTNMPPGLAVRGAPQRECSEDMEKRKEAAGLLKRR